MGPVTWIALLLTVIQGATSDSPSAPFLGAFLGKLNTYAHQVTGEVYVIDEYTFLIKNFFYDGLAQDAFFWVGATVRPSNIGFIIPDEKGRTNRLRRYSNQDITLRLAEDKKISSLKWLSIWDIRDNHNLADVYIPEGFEPPSAKKISEFTRGTSGSTIKSGVVTIIDSRTIRIPDFYYDGSSNSAYFWVGTGPAPNPSGKKIPNELGYLESLGRYDGETITLTLTGDTTVFNIDWLAVWDEETGENLGSLNIPEGLNIPPNLAIIKKLDSRLPNCQQLHRRVQLRWEIFGPQITFEVTAQMKHNEYIAIGQSASPNSSRMVNSDVAISYLDGHQGYTIDYNITDKFPCTNVNGYYRGICPDDKVGGIDNYQILTFYREEEMTRITFRRNLLNTGDEGDLVFSKEEPSYFIWAIGRLNKFKEPRLHHLYPKRDVKIHLGRKPEKNCFPFVLPSSEIASASASLATSSISSGTGSGSGSTASGGLSGSDSSSGGGSVDKNSWGPLKIVNQTLTTFYARLGEAGGDKGYTRLTNESSPGLVWYINGLMAPTIFARRGTTYVFRVEGGNNPSNAYLYHPLYITNDPHGGYSKYRDEERKKVAIYAGVEFDRKGRPSPTSAGRLCLWSYPNSFDPRKVDTKFHTFLQFRSFLNYTCDRGSPAILQWTPNASTPDVVYYQSYTQRNMGWKIIVLDDFSSNLPVLNSGDKCLHYSLYFIVNTVLAAVTCVFLYP